MSLRRSLLHRDDAGFTLVELLVVMAAITILSAMALPRLTGYLRQSHLEASKPYLAEIAARERAYFLENGQYCCHTSSLNENRLVSGLLLKLADTGDFCFVVVCQSSTLCQSVAGPGFITGSTAAPDFEVWAILQDGLGSANPGPGSVNCSPATGKVAATGFVAPATSGVAGRGGQAVVLRYPPPANGRGAVGQYHAVTFDWRDGISLTDASLP